MPRMVELEEEVGLAEAIFDNEAEWPDELVFSRGDILHVLDQHPAGGLADGWWLCADKQGRRGIAPANRLKMIHNFGQGRNRVITPRRFGDVFLYNHRLFNETGEDFFRQPAAGSFFNTVYDVPTALRNLYLLHGSDHPFLLGEKIGNAGSASNDNLPTARSGVGDRQPIIRNVPIRLEKRGEADGAQKTSDDYGVSLKSSSANGNPHRARSPPPPPPQRRHFNLNGPLLLSSLVTVPATSSTSSSGSDEERLALAGGGSGQPSPNNALLKNGSTVRSQLETPALSDLSSSPSIRQLSASFYDSPSSLLTNSSPLAPKLSPTRAAENPLLSSVDGSSSPSLARRSATSNSTVSQERPRYATILKKDPLSSEQQRRSPMTVSSISNGSPSTSSRQMNANAVLSSSTTNPNEVNSITTYDVPRSLRPAPGDGSKATTANRMQNYSSAADGIMASSVSPAVALAGERMAEESRGSVEPNLADRPAYKSIMQTTPGKKFGPTSSGETDAERLSISSMDSKSSDYQELLTGSSELRLSAAVAMDTLIKLLENLQAAVDKLCSFAIRNWRRKDYLENHIVDIRASCRQTIAALKDFFDFSSGAFVNVNKVAVSNLNAPTPTATGATSVDGRLGKHLAHLVRPLGDSLRLLIKLQQTLDVSGWMVAKLARDGAGNDSLDQFIAVAKQVPQDARQVASFIHGNITLIFPPSLLNSFNASATSARILSVNGSANSAASSVSSPPSVQPPQQRSVRFAEDVHLSTGEIASINGGSSNGSSNEAKSYRAVTNGGTTDSTDTSSSGGEDVVDSAQTMRRSVFDDYDYVGEPSAGRESNGGGGDPEVNKTANGESILPPEDRQILQFYSPQVENHIACLSNAIDDFLLAVEQNEPPKVFVGHSKFVILGAHKLVYIGDSIAQCIRRRELGEKVKHCADHLCEVLKYSVTATKQAALQFPSVPCVQAMVDSMVNVSHAAYELKLLIQEAANL